MKALKIYLDNIVNKFSPFLALKAEMLRISSFLFLLGMGANEKEPGKKGLLFCLVFIVLIFSSCEKINLKTSDDNVAVVESYIEPGNYLAVKIKRQITFEEGVNNDPFIGGLKVQVVTTTGNAYLEYVNDSLYTTTHLNIGEGDEVSLNFEYNNLIIESQTEIPSKPTDFSLSPSSIEISTEFGPGMGGNDVIEIEWSNPDADYHMLVVENIEDDPELIRDDDDRPPRSFRNAPTQGESQELNGLGFTYYGIHRVVLFKLNPEYAALYEDLNTTSLDLTAPPSNITNGLGIFTGINSDTLFIQVNKAD